MKYGFITQHKKTWPISLMCQVLGVSRHNYYSAVRRNEQHEPDPQHDELIEWVQKIADASDFTYGVRRMKRALNSLGYPVGKQRTRALMKEADVSVRRRRKYKVTTNSDHQQPVFDNVLSRDFDAQKPDQAYVSDITYIWTQEGWLYLAVVIDLFSRKVVGWSMTSRMKNVHSQTLYAYDSKTTQKHFDSPLAPKTQINKKLILENWDDILRLMASMKLKRCSASQMLKMLSSSERDNTLYKAFKEFGRLLKTHFILNFIDDEDLRQNIQKQLNRVELGQKLADKVMFGRNGKIQVGLQDEIQLVMASNTLLRNIIILWNYLFLSDYCVSLNSQDERAEVIESISTGSVISWAHINFMGIYEFNPDGRSRFAASLKQMRNVAL